MPEDYSSGGSDPVAGAARSPATDLTAEEMMSFVPNPARPYWMVTRFPVSMEEYGGVSPLGGGGPGSRGAAAGRAWGSWGRDGRGRRGRDHRRRGPRGRGRCLEAPEGETVATVPAALAPGLSANFEGLPQTAFQPPDNALAVGPNDVLVAVNTDLAGYSKAGALRFRWPNMGTLFNAVLPPGASLFDPRLAYDHYDQRWIVVSGARRESPAGSWLMVGISQGTDPAGAYWTWALDASLDGDTPTNNWADYPMLGFDTQAIYIASNMFQFSGGFAYVKLRILRKSDLYAGGSGPNHTIRWHDLWNLKNPDNTLAFTVQPAVHFRGTGGNPPAYLANALWPGGSSLTFWTLSNPLAFWAGGAPTLTRAAVNCRAYELPPDAQQLGSAVRVETNDARLLNAIYQFTGGVQRLWTCHTSRHTWPGDAEARSVVQWYEVDVPSKGVTQQGRFGANGRYYFFPAIQTDLNRNAYLVFSRCGSGEPAQLRQTGRRVGDTPGDLQSSTLVKTGEGAYNGGRWGDYFGICRDGGDPSTVWMYGEYADTGNTWATRVCAARFG